MATPINRKQVLGQKGFTLLELIVVLLIIGLLGALFYVGRTSVERNNRNTLREQDINTIYKQLEAYYVVNQKYPTLGDMNSSSWLAKNMPNLQPSTLKDPLGKSDQLVARPQKDAYAYQVSSANGAGCNDTTTPCAHYTLTATLERSPQKTYVQSSLN